MNPLVSILKKVLMFLVLAGVVAGGVYLIRQRTQASGLAKTDTAEITRGNLNSKITATGKLQAVTQITVGSQVSGIIQSLYVDFNSRVKKGQPLAQIDPATFRAQVEQTTASVNSALSDYSNQQANVGNQQANVRSTEAAILSAQAKVDASAGSLASARASVITAEANLRKGQADLALARRNQERQSILRDRDLVASIDLDQAVTTTLTNQATVDSLRAQVDGARANYRSAEANVKAAQAEVSAARMRREAALQQVTSAQAQMAGAQARVSQARANLSQVQVNLDFTTIRSPIDGIVLDRKVTVGQTVAAQFQAPDLFTLAENLDLIQVQVAVDEADIGQVKESAKATFTVDAFPEDRFRGTVTEVRQSPIVESNVVTYVVIIDTRNPQGKLKPGMTATVNIEVDSRQDVLLLPNAALRFKPPGVADAPRRRPTAGASPRASGDKPREPRVRKVSVYTIDPKDPAKFVEHRIVPGITDGVHTEIVESDLKEGQAVVTGQSTGKSPTTPAATGGSRSRGMRMF